MSRYQVFDAFQDAVLVVDSALRLHYGNPAASIIFGVSTKRLSAKREISQFVTLTPSLAQSRDEIERITEVTRTRELAFRLASGGEGWAQVTLQPAPEFFAESAGAEKHWLIYFRDVTLEKNLHVKYRAELDMKESVIKALEAAHAKLELYSKNLEKMVDDRTTELRQANAWLKTILDSLGQGILVFGPDGRCLPIYSQVCLRLLQADPAGKMIEDVLKLSGKDAVNFASWRGLVFDELLDFRDMVPLAPHRFEHDAGLEIALDYHPMRGTNGKLAGVVLVATDRTMEMRALRKAERERELVAKVTQVARNREAFRGFVVDARQLLESLRAAEDMDIGDLARKLHTLKGAAASFSLATVAEACHGLEDELKLVSAGADRSRFNHKLKISADKVLADLNHELNELGQLLGPIGAGEETQTVELPLSKVRQWSQALLGKDGAGKAHDIGIQLLKESSEKSVGQSVQHVASSLGELAHSLGKKMAQVEIRGGDLKIPIHFGQSLFASLVHAFRNAVYHGLEAPFERKALGKPEGGRITVTFERIDFDGRAGLSITIEDDGRGIDPATIREKLVERGMDSLACGPDDEVIQAILRDDFSTSQGVNAVAGRGVGLAAIASEARKLGGAVHVRSSLGQGMSLSIRVPLPRGASEPKGRAA